MPRWATAGETQYVRAVKKSISATLNISSSNKILDQQALNVQKSRIIYKLTLTIRARKLFVAFEISLVGQKKKIFLLSIEKVKLLQKNK